MSNPLPLTHTACFFSEDTTPTQGRPAALGKWFAGAATDKHGPAQPAGSAELPDTAS